jgi:hypothetical protein
VTAPRIDLDELRDWLHFLVHRTARSLMPNAARDLERLDALVAVVRTQLEREAADDAESSFMFGPDCGADAYFAAQARLGKANVEAHAALDPFRPAREEKAP